MKKRNPISLFLCLCLIIAMLLPTLYACTGDGGEQNTTEQPSMEETSDPGTSGELTSNPPAQTETDTEPEDETDTTTAPETTPDTEQSTEQDTEQSTEQGTEPPPRRAGLDAAYFAH